jgi:hypothetical protein
MPTAALGFGAALILVGLISYVATGGKSITALIPSYLGILLALAGGLAFKAHLRKHAMHGAAALAAAGFLMSAGRLVSVLVRGSALPSTAGALSMSSMALLCLVFLILCIRSFMQARRARLLVERNLS